MVLVVVKRSWKVVEGKRRLVVVGINLVLDVKKGGGEVVA